jgi:hypothetical protein
MVPPVVKNKRLSLLVAAATAALAGAGGAMTVDAHPETFPAHVNRYLTAIATGDRLELFVTLLFGEVPGREERARLDGDRDGKLSPAELAAGRAEWKRRAASLASFSLDGRPLPLDEATADLQLGKDDTVAAAPLVLEVFHSRPLGPGPHTIVIAAGADPPRPGETELVLDSTPDWEIASSRRARDAEGTQNRFRLEGPRASVMEDRSATFHIRPSSTPARGGRSRTLIAALAAIAVVLAAAALMAGRKRR